MEAAVSAIEEKHTVDSSLHRRKSVKDELKLLERIVEDEVYDQKRVRPCPDVTEPACLLLLVLAQLLPTGSSHGGACAAGAPS